MKSGDGQTRVVRMCETVYGMLRDRGAGDNESIKECIVGTTAEGALGDYIEVRV